MRKLNPKELCVSINFMRTTLPQSNFDSRELRKAMQQFKISASNLSIFVAHFLTKTHCGHQVTYSWVTGNNPIHFSRVESYLKDVRTTNSAYMRKWQARKHQSTTNVISTNVIVFDESDFPEDMCDSMF